jgi:hypothetical protein
MTSYQTAEVGQGTLHQGGFGKRRATHWPGQDINSYGSPQAASDWMAACGSASESGVGGADALGRIYRVGS